MKGEIIWKTSVATTTEAEDASFVSQGNLFRIMAYLKAGKLQLDQPPFRPLPTH